MLRLSRNPVCNIIVRIQESILENPCSTTTFYCGVPGDINSKYISSFFCANLFESLVSALVVTEKYSDIFIHSPQFFRKGADFSFSYYFLFVKKYHFNWCLSLGLRYNYLKVYNSVSFVSLGQGIFLLLSQGGTKSKVKRTLLEVG